MAVVSILYVYSCTCIGHNTHPFPNQASSSTFTERSTYNNFNVQGRAALDLERASLQLRRHERAVHDAALANCEAAQCVSRARRPLGALAPP